MSHKGACLQCMQPSLCPFAEKAHAICRFPHTNDLEALYGFIRHSNYQLYRSNDALRKAKDPLVDAHYMNIVRTAVGLHPVPP